MLKGSQLAGRKFRRQHSVANYILDFYCPSERLAVELDGAVHDSFEAQEYDRERDLFLEQFGIKVLRCRLRFWLASALVYIPIYLLWLPKNLSAAPGRCWPCRRCTRA